MINNKTIKTYRRSSPPSTPIFKLPSSMARHCVYLRARPPQCIFKFGIVLKVSFLGGPLATLDLSSKDLTYTRPTYFGTHLGSPSFGASPPLGSTSLTGPLSASPQRFP